MPKIRFHQAAATLVLVLAASWIASGKFSSVGSATRDSEERPVSQVALQQPDVGAESQSSLRTVAVVRPTFMEHRRAIRISGLTAPDKRTTLAARRDGIVASLPVKDGQHVNAGARIMSLDAEEKPAMVEMARTVLAQRQKEFDAAEKLLRNGNLASLQADAARSAMAQAQSQLMQAQAELDRIELSAPFDGVVDKVLVEEGSFVQTGAGIAILLKLDPIKVVGEVSERELEHVAIGTSAEVHLVDGRVVPGAVSHVSREATGQTRTFAVEIAIANPGDAIPAGMTAEITLRAEPQQAVALPRSVITLSEKGDLGVHVLDDKDMVRFVAIDLIDDTTQGLVLGGIPNDSRIIVAGQGLVSAGDQVKAVEQDPLQPSLLSETASGKVD